MLPTFDCGQCKSKGLSQWRCFRSMFPGIMVLGLLLIVGCGGKPTPEGFPDLVPCQVEVIQDGKPLAEATVGFVSDQLQWAVGGVTNEQGVAQMYTHGDFEGSPEGDFRVTITKTVIEGAPTPEQLASPSFSGRGGEAFDYVDLQYKDPKNTPFQVKVSGTTREKFDVGKPIHKKVTIR
ncbi:MAG: hypothetical protein PHE53_01010 [Thermoguttaceae bacterium]|nr:hypothetical protein [Thermoguttaceae bacterium]